ncbi:MAG TPA: DUF302 domain-containing protein [Ktedonobacteraceae bacterium]
MQNAAFTVSVHQQERTVTQVVIESKRPYDEVIQAFEANTHQVTTDQFVQLVENAKTFAEYSHSIDMVLGEKRFLRIWDLDLGFGVSRYFRPLKGKEYLFGNPALAFQMLARQAGVGFYVPFRVYFSEDTPGSTHITYDQPSSFLRQFNSEIF